MIAGPQNIFRQATIEGQSQKVGYRNLPPGGGIGSAPVFEPRTMQNSRRERSLLPRNDDTP